MSINIKTGITNTVSRWYSIKYDEWHGNNSVYKWKESSYWIGVEDFYAYSIRNGARSYICDSFREIENRARIGDVVKLKISNGRWYHSIMITGESRGKLLYSGHTNDHSNTELRDTGESQYRIIRY
ncbi:amidase domain-containing protein [Tissierella pigra]|uniref:amidase domain-containing protein n=1 Tax=Tissierella pigra TaxID=2607614 RepID=UPI001C11D354|nr:amidase domain-containing protein [Tissierella pigra]MBU5426101.1 amidase domain-containing protein [Tissierella pigra]